MRKNREAVIFSRLSRPKKEGRNASSGLTEGTPMRKIAGLLTCMILFAAQAEARAAEDSYFIIVFGGQRPLIKAPRHAHSWATFVHVRPDGIAEEFTISWL